MAKYGEFGRVGQRRFGGIFYEEFLAELRGHRGIETFREMSENDDMIGAIMFAIEMLIRQVQWDVEAAGRTEKDKAAKEFVLSCMYDMSETWTDTISEILSFLTFGWSAHEIVYKRRGGKTKDPKTNSKYSDNLIGWQKLPIRSQDSLYRWEYDSADNLVAMVQRPAPDYTEIAIPAEKLLLFRTKSNKNNPEGRSILRNAYRDWYFKKRIQEIEGIGIERDLAGFPVLYAPEGMDIWNDSDPDMQKAYAAATSYVEGLRRDTLQGAVFPSGWRLELLSSSNTRSIDTDKIIERYDNRMAMTVLADFLTLGHQNVGSFALSSDKTALFAAAIGAYLDMICEVFNKKAIPDLLDINGDFFQGITDYPQLTHGDIESTELETLSSYVNKVVSCGAMMPDEELENYLRNLAGLPERSDISAAPKQVNQVKPTTDAADEAAALTAKKSLGRC